MQKPTSCLVLLVLLLCALTSNVFATSFDCAKASGSTESLICKNADLSQLDSGLQSAYKAALAAVARLNKPALIKEQRDWIKYTRNLCEDAACLKQAYTARIDVLARNEKYIVDRTSCDMTTGHAACVNVVSYRDTAIRIDAFNRSLAQQKSAGTIIGCSSLINLPVGYAGSNNSFGGICTLQDGAKRRQVVICNDDMVGHFAIQSVDHQGVADRQLIDFTHGHCFGG